MTSTDRLSNLNSRREITDRMGGTVVLGNSIISADLSAVPIIVAAAAGASEAKSNFQLNPIAALLMFNGSFGTIGADFTINPNALLQAYGAQVWKVNLTAAAIALLQSVGASIFGVPLNVTSASTLAFSTLAFAANNLSSTASTTMNMGGKSTAAGPLYSTPANATFIMVSFIRATANFTIASAGSLQASGTGLYKSNWTASTVALLQMASTLILASQATITCTSLLQCAASTVQNSRASTLSTATVTAGSKSTVAGLARIGAGAVASGAMYLTGGLYPFDSTGNIEKFSFADEAIAISTATLSTVRYSIIGTYSSTKGYVAGGENDTGSRYNVIDALVFSSDTCGSIAATLDAAREATVGTQSSTRGYFIGGRVGVSSAITDTIEALVFASDTHASVSALLATKRYDNGNVTSATKSYLGAGHSDTANILTLESFRYSDETTIAVAAVFSDYSLGPSGFYTDTNGYFAGGWDTFSTYTTIIRRLRYADESLTDLSAVLAVGSSSGQSGQSALKGYNCGGYTSSSKTISSMLFSTETAVTIAATITSDRQEGCGLSSPSTASGLTMAGTSF